MPSYKLVAGSPAAFCPTAVELGQEYNHDAVVYDYICYILTV